MITEFTLLFVCLRTLAELVFSCVKRIMLDLISFVLASQGNRNTPPVCFTDFLGEQSLQYVFEHTKNPTWMARFSLAANISPSVQGRDAESVPIPRVCTDSDSGTVKKKKKRFIPFGSFRYMKSTLVRNQRSAKYSRTKTLCVYLSTSTTTRAPQFVTLPASKSNNTNKTLRVQR
jgi:hypothetical protein